MKKSILSVIALVLSLLALTSCGKSRADKLMDRYAEIANMYSSLSADVAKKNDTALLGNFSSYGIELTDIASSLAKSGEEMSAEELDKIEVSLEEIESALLSLSGDKAK